MRALDYIDTEKSTVRPSERDCPSEHSGDYLSGGGGGGEGVLILRATSILKSQEATSVKTFFFVKIHSIQKQCYFIPTC